MLVLKLLEKVGSLIFSLETILNDSLFKIFQILREINASRDTLNNSNLLALLCKCDTVNLLK